MIVSDDDTASLISSIEDDIVSNDDGADVQHEGMICVVFSLKPCSEVAV